MGDYHKRKKDKNDIEIKEVEEYFKNNILKISLFNIEYDEYIAKAKEYARFLKENNLTTSQIRKVYSDIMRANSTIELKKLRPKLAYIYGRNIRNKAIKSFMDILDKGIEDLKPENNEEEVKSIKEFAETIVAYRKYFGDNK